MTKVRKQNLPSREKHFPIKNVYCPPKGAILCATDYSFIELVCLAQSCYTRFGHSVLRDIINANVDPHRWFAAVRDGLISNDTEFTRDPKAVEDMNAFLKENVSKEARQAAKSSNFGFGGGMSWKRFYINCRQQGMQLTQQTAEHLRAAWIAAYSEMKEHMVPEPMPQKALVASMYGQWMAPSSEDADDDEGDDPNDNRQFIAHLINGMTRAKCSFCAALNSQFQPIAAYGIKMGMWDMAMQGYLDRLVNEVHDEVNYWLWPHELKTHVPVIERCMIDGMRRACPDVMVKVETTCMLHWDKNAVDYADLKWDDDGNPIIEEPEFVKQVYGISSDEKP